MSERQDDEFSTDFERVKITELKAIISNLKTISGDVYLRTCVAAPDLPSLGKIPFKTCADVLALRYGKQAEEVRTFLVKGFKYGFNCFTALDTTIHSGCGKFCQTFTLQTERDFEMEDSADSS
tara:strand:+ start:1874 stop:2242 length:369 start_codon:yes stop_codon:yes gene_type:complete